MKYSQIKKCVEQHLQTCTKQSVFAIYCKILGMEPSEETRQLIKWDE